MRNPEQSEGCTAQYETKSVDIVHTPISAQRSIKPSIAPYSV
ncbi:hypothetical protein GA0061083_1444 [Pseudarthrobacter enclensis]|nr:hypothetical protein GA0061083_1444 [Pseudarthrobacter enclensis]